MGRRVQVQADHVGGLGLEIGIVGRQIAFNAVGLKRVLGSDARNAHVRHVDRFGSQFARRPMCRSISRFAFSGPGEHFGFYALHYRIAFAPRVPGEQPRESIRRKAPAPTIDIAVAVIELEANLGPRQFVGQQQDQPCVARHVRARVPGSGMSSECGRGALE